MLADDLNVQVVAPMMYDSTSSSDDDDEAVMVRMASADNDDEVERHQRQNNAPVAISNVYNKRDAFFKVPDLIAKRMNRRVAHLPCSARTQSS